LAGDGPGAGGVSGWGGVDAGEAEWVAKNCGWEGSGRKKLRCMKRWRGEDYEKTYRI
jgi:hypothetical protein